VAKRERGEKGGKVMFEELNEQISRTKA